MATTNVRLCNRPCMHILVLGDITCACVSSLSVILALHTLNVRLQDPANPTDSIPRRYTAATACMHRACLEACHARVLHPTSFAWLIL